MRTLYRTIKSFPLRTRIEKFRPYYQDKLSRDLLSDQLKFFVTADWNLFMQRAIKEGWTYTRLAGFMLKGKFSLDKYTGYVIIDYDDKGLAEYTRNLLTVYGLHDKIRTVTLKDFLNGAEVTPSELLIAAFSWKGHAILREYVDAKNIPCDIATLIIGKHEEVQYFDVFSPIDNEIIVDAGCFDGMTALRFLEWGGSKIKHIYSFELDPANFPACEERIKPYADRVTLVKKGTWNQDEPMYISSNSAGTSSSHAAQSGTVQAFMTPIDSVVQDEHVTFIKMDVEGAELKSLMGARNTIIKNHPRLAICAYHKASDLYELPEYILSLVPEYKFLLRRYDSHFGETVLYAYCE